MNGWGKKIPSYSNSPLIVILAYDDQILIFSLSYFITIVTDFLCDHYLIDMLTHLHNSIWFQISLIFGGIDICSVEAVVGKDDKEYIIEVNDCATTLFGESQEDDRKYIAELTLKSMEVSSSKDES